MIDYSYLGQVENAKPIWLSGVYRSGTTFLAAVVNNISNIKASSSTVKYLRFCLPYFGLNSNDDNYKKLVIETAKRVKKRWKLNLNIQNVLNSLEKKNINHAEIYNAIMNELLLSNDSAARWAEKLAMQWRDIPLFLKMFPKGKVIHIFRDPRDVTSSYKKMTYEKWPTFLDAALNCKAAMIDLPNFQESFGDDRIMIIKAEDLAYDLPASMKKICGFLGEKYMEEFSSIDTFNNIAGEDWRSNTSFKESENNFLKAKSRWEENLSLEELFLVEMFCQPHMSQMGYEGSNSDFSKINNGELYSLISDPWLSKRINKYLSTGFPQQGYRTDPYKTEMEIVFGSTIQDYNNQE